MRDLLVDFDPNSTFGDIPDVTSATMVELMWHSLVEGAINLDIDIITNVVGSEVCGQGDGTLLPEGAREGISGVGSQTVTSRHFC